MSYLTLQNGIPDFSKAVFSFWFRVPKVSAVAASSNFLETGAEGFRMMQSILPLVTFGVPQQNKNYQLVYKDIAHGNPTGADAVEIEAVRWEAKTPYDVDPCFIGIMCRSDGTFDMAFNIQMGTTGSYSSLLYFATDMAYIFGVTAAPVGSGIVGQWYKTTITDGSFGIQDAQPEYFYVESHNIGFKPDEWHHLLLSFDVSGLLAVGRKPSSTCQLWYAVDDKDYMGWQNRQPFRDADDGLVPNAIVTKNIYRESVPFTNNLFFNNYIAAPSGGYTPEPIPGSAPFGIPAGSKYLDSIFRVEMAEFQMWTGVTLDTSIESNRRAFIDKDGKPVNPTQGTVITTTKRFDPRGPGERLLGKKPEVMLHGDQNWIDGYNTGTVGVLYETKPDGVTLTKKPEGQFTRTAAVEKYDPEPQLIPEPPPEPPTA